jgi:hypothetical protein
LELLDSGGFDGLMILLIHTNPAWHLTKWLNDKVGTKMANSGNNSSLL